ncbi:hypothetical protein Bca101_088124 [Brassica carinata]
MAYKSLDSITRSDIEALGISDDVSYKLLRDLDDIIRNHGSSATPPERWIEISRRILHPDLPFSFHQMMYYGCYKDFGPDPPAWDVASLTNVGGLLERRGREFLGDDYKDPVSSFSKFQEFSVSNPEVYWRTILDELNILFSVPPKCVLDRDRSGDNPGGNWLPGAYLNPARNCLSSSSKRRSDDDVVIRWRNEGSDDLPVNAMTLLELRSQVWLTAHALNALDLVEESAIAIDMPMNVESVIIYLAIVLAGHVVVSIADSFSPREISTRLKISKAKAIFTQDEIIRGDKSIPLYRRVVDAEAPLAIVIPARGSFVRMNLRENDLSWNEFLGNAGKMRGMEYIAVEKPAGACTNILFSSGTTGEPKAIPWTNISPLKSAADAWCHMDVHQGDVVAWPTNLGWMMGPWLVYASLINGACMALYNGSPPGPAFAKFVQDAEVTMLGVIPSIVRTWQNSNSTFGFDWSRIRCFGSTGEASNVDEYLWLMSRAHYKPVIEYCGGTEIGGSFVTGSLLQPQSLAAFSTAAMGCKLFILGEDCNPLPPDAEGVGELALWPHVFGASSSLLNGNHYNVYFKGMPTFQGQILRRHGDLFERTSKGYYRAQGRADDTMNLGGIKVGSVEIERVCNSVDDSVLETAAIGVPPPSGGPEQLVIAVVLKSQELTNRDLNLLKKSFNSEIQKKLNPLFKVSSVVTLPSLPRTATNKSWDITHKFIFFTKPQDKLKQEKRRRFGTDGRNHVVVSSSLWLYYSIFSLHRSIEAVISLPPSSFLHFTFFRRWNSALNHGIQISHVSRTFKTPKCSSADSPYGGNVPTFPRARVWDPYKRLGISPYASEEEIWASRNFLLEQYAGHERSQESIEGAFEKLLMSSFVKRKKTKINLKTRLKKKVEESPPWLKALFDFVEMPPMDTVFRRLFLFAFMGGWSIMNSAEGGPAFQVAVSLAACIYFLNEKTKSLGRAFLIGIGALVAGWFCGSLVIPMIPTVLINPAWTLELLTSLVIRRRGNAGVGVDDGLETETQTHQQVCVLQTPVALADEHSCVMVTPAPAV